MNRKRLDVAVSQILIIIIIMHQGVQMNAGPAVDAEAFLVRVPPELAA